MITCLILVLVSLAIFCVYNTLSLRKFGVPKSLSETFYLWNGVKNHLGYIFTGMMYSMALTLLPAWLELSPLISSWSIYTRPLTFFTCGAIAFVGAAPAFRKDKMEAAVHNISARIAAVAAIIWCLVTCWQIMYVPLGIAALVAIAGWVTKTWKTSNVYWLEMMAFAATFGTVIVELVLQLV